MPNVKIVINPKYSQLRDFIDRVPSGDYLGGGEVMRDRRNRIDCIEAAPGCQVVVKRFEVPPLYRRLIYTLSWSKARRSYKYAMRLEKAGVPTAERIAYIETRRGGVFHTGYYITEYLPHPLLDTLESLPMPKMIEVGRDFADYTAALHLKNISHRDYNPKNIFFHHDGDGYRFHLVDINRMHFGRLSRRRCIKEISRLTFSLPVLVGITERYAKTRGWSPQKFCARLLVFREINPHWRVKKSLKPIKRFLRGKK